MKRYYIYEPSLQGEFTDEWNQCLKLITGTALEGFRPVKVNIFISVPDNRSFLEALKTVTENVVEVLGDKSPAVSVTVHPPKKPWKVSVEALFLVPGTGKAETRFYGSIPYVIINYFWGKEVWAAGLGAGYFSQNIRESSENAFNHTVKLLAKEGLSLNNIIRQWNYIGNILDVRNGLQHYQVFNEVRSEYYSHFRTVTGYPAATGIGLKSDSVIIDLCAVDPDKSVIIRGLSNPNQVNAYEYNQKVLKGVKGQGKDKKQPPQFERALLMTVRDRSVLYISGTASIIGQSTIGKNNVKEQTVVTLENIKKLVDTELISQAVAFTPEFSPRLRLLRIYVRHQEDFSIVTSVCTERFPDVTMICIEADVCRNDLLVEIEAEAEIY